MKELYKITLGDIQRLADSLDEKEKKELSKSIRKGEWGEKPVTKVKL